MEEKFREIFEKSPIGIIFFDKEGKLTDANPSALEIVGVSSLNDVIGLNIFNKVNMGSKKDELLEKGHIKLQTPLNFDNVKKLGIYKPKRSGTVFLDLTISVINSGFLVQIQDITERKRTEEKYQELVENASSIILRYDTSGKITFFNEFAEQFFGYTQKEILGKHAVGTIIPQTESTTGRDLEQMVQDIVHHPEKYANNENENIRKNGDRVWIRWTNKPVFDEKCAIKEFLAVGIDITERKKVEDALKEREHIYRTVFENTEDGFQLVELIYDNDGKVCDFQYLKTNLAFERQSGLKASDIIGKKAKQVLPNVEPYWFEMYDKVAKDGKPMHDERYNQDTNRWYDLFCFPYSKSKVGVLFNDITGRKKAEEIIEAERQRFYDVMEMLPAYLVLLTQDHHVAFANRFFRERFGEDCGQRCFEYLFGLTEPCENCETYKVLKTGAPHHWEWTGPDGRNYDIYDFPFKDTDGSLLIMEFGIDITERKKAEEELQRSKESFRTLAENSPDIIIRLDRDLRYVYTNPTVTEKTGKSPEYYIGKTYEEAGIPEKYATLWKESNLKAFETGEIQHQEFEFPSINGLRSIESNVVPEFNANSEIESLLILSRDITERKKMENALKESEEKYRDLFNKANDMITLSEIKADGMPGKYIEVNEVGIKRLGYNREEFLNLGPIDIVAPEYRAEMPKNASVMAGKGSGNFEIVHVTKDGKRIPVEVNGHIINYKGKKAYLTVSRDITERKTSEEQLKETIKELKRSNQELQSFAYITSHDLQEPLRTMGNYAGLLKRRYKGKLDEDADDFLDFMAYGASRMKDMVQGLLDYSRVGTQAGEFEEFSSEESLNHALINLQSAIEECHAEVTYDKLPTIIADKSQITRVFQNLIGNALKFSREGIRPKIHISARKEDNEYIFSVSDNGIGMDEQYTDRIFEVFKRLHAIGEYEGTGIGLAIVKRIIDRHHGRLWVESEYGKGSVFYFTIPIKNENIETEEESSDQRNLDDYFSNN